MCVHVCMYERDSARVVLQEGQALGKTGTVCYSHTGYKSGVSSGGNNTEFIIISLIGTQSL